jgi:hypothetical protein
MLTKWMTRKELEDMLGEPSDTPRTDAGMTQEQKAAYWFDLYLEETTRRRRLERALQSIAANTCCDKCQEAALVAKKALS